MKVTRETSEHGRPIGSAHRFVFVAVMMALIFGIAVGVLVVNIGVLVLNSRTCMVREDALYTVAGQTADGDVVKTEVRRQRCAQWEE